jgi:hypothetical protein
MNRLHRRVIQFLDGGAALKPPAARYILNYCQKLVAQGNEPDLIRPVLACHQNPTRYGCQRLWM